MKKLLLALFSLTAMLAVDANAIELRFSFKVNSSGPAIYACNAGLEHKDEGDQYCYLQSTGAACRPGDCNGNVACLEDCVCSSLGGGNNRRDYFMFNYCETMCKDSNCVRDCQATSKGGPIYAGETTYNTAFSAANTYDNRIQDLVFNFGSERYGARYFLDICYRGSLIDYLKDGAVAPHALTSNVSVTDLSSDPTLSYKKLSALTTSAEVICTLADGSSFTAQKGTPQSLQGGTIQFWNSLFINTNANTPKACRVRYYFNETQRNGLRKNCRHDANVCTFTKIWESN